MLMICYFKNKLSKKAASKFFFLGTQELFFSKKNFNTFLLLGSFFFSEEKNMDEEDLVSEQQQTSFHFENDDDEMPTSSRSSGDVSTTSQKTLKRKSEEEEEVVAQRQTSLSENTETATSTPVAMTSNIQQRLALMRKNAEEAKKECVPMMAKFSTKKVEKEDAAVKQEEAEKEEEKEADTKPLAKLNLKQMLLKKNQPLEQQQSARNDSGKEKTAVVTPTKRMGVNENQLAMKTSAAGGGVSAPPALTGLQMLLQRKKQVAATEEKVDLFSQQQQLSLNKRSRESPVLHKNNYSQTISSKLLKPKQTVVAQKLAHFSIENVKLGCMDADNYFLPLFSLHGGPLFFETTCEGTIPVKFGFQQFKFLISIKINIENQESQKQLFTLQENLQPLIWTVLELNPKIANVTKDQIKWWDFITLHVPKKPGDRQFAPLFSVETSEEDLAAGNVIIQDEAHPDKNNTFETMAGAFVKKIRWELQGVTVSDPNEDGEIRLSWRKRLQYALINSDMGQTNFELVTPDIALSHPANCTRKHALPIDLKDFNIETDIFVGNMSSNAPTTTSEKKQATSANGSNLQRKGGLPAYKKALASANVGRNSTANNNNAKGKGEAGKGKTNSESKVKPRIALLYLPDKVTPVYLRFTGGGQILRNFGLSFGELYGTWQLSWTMKSSEEVAKLGDIYNWLRMTTIANRKKWFPKEFKEQDETVGSFARELLAPQTRKLTKEQREALDEEALEELKSIPIQPGEATWPPMIRVTIDLDHLTDRPDSRCKVVDGSLRRWKKEEVMANICGRNWVEIIIELRCIYLGDKKSCFSTRVAYVGLESNNSFFEVVGEEDVEAQMTEEDKELMEQQQQQMLEEQEQFYNDES